MEANCRCAIWGTPAVGDGNTGGDGTLVDSPRAGGRYLVSGSAVPMLARLDDRLKARLTTWLVAQRRLGNTCREITTATIKEAEERPDLRVADRTDRVLMLCPCGRRSSAVPPDRGSVRSLCCLHRAVAFARLSCIRSPAVSVRLHRRSWFRNYGDVGSTWCSPSPVSESGVFRKARDMTAKT